MLRVERDEIEVRARCGQHTRTQSSGSTVTETPPQPLPPSLYLACVGGSTVCIVLTPPTQAGEAF